jgi:hypothetical protein
MTESGDGHLEKRKVILFDEAAGKTVASIRLNNDSHRPALEVRFTDGTFFWFELVPRVALEIRSMEQRDGDLEIVRDYGPHSGNSAS